MTGDGTAAKAPAQGAVVTVGAFDGIHLGHRALIAATVEQARSEGASPVVLTFSTHPATVLRPQRAPRLLCTPDEKVEAIAPLGVERLVLLEFTRALADLSAREFVERVLVDRLGVRHLVIGHDHALGRDRVGDATELRRLGAELGFGVTVVDAVQLDGAGISSSRIREALVRGAISDASRLLGRPYWLTGRVVRGAGRGRDLGVPTANLEIDSRKLIPAHGIYACWAWAWPVDGVPAQGAAREPGPCDAVLHIGPRPVFDDPRPTVEVHLLGFSGNLYGTRVRLELVRRIRDVESFDSVDALVAAIGQDVRDARAALRAASAFAG